MQPNGYPPLNDPYWGPPPSQQSGGWASRTGPGRYNNNNNNNFNRNNGGFQGFSSDPTTDLLLQVRGDEQLQWCEVACCGDAGSVLILGCVNIKGFALQRLLF